MKLIHYDRDEDPFNKPNPEIPEEPTPEKQPKPSEGLQTLKGSEQQSTLTAEKRKMEEKKAEGDQSGELYTSI